MSWKDSAQWTAENKARIQLARKRDWLEAGACRGLDPEIFFPERGEDERPAKKICRACTVRTECLTYALDSAEKFGIWGGTSERQRRRLRAERLRANPRILKQPKPADGPMNHPPIPTPHESRTEDAPSEEAQRNLQNARQTSQNDRASDVRREVTQR
jgi:WhiB family transcriptional regulator, redox-sensing transcriptional regulator